MEDFAIPYDAADVAAFLDKRHGPAAMAAWIADPAMRMWVATLDDVLAGYAAAGPMSLPHDDAGPDDAELYRLYVQRAFQGRGAAQGLMEAAMDWMATRPRRWIGVWSGNLRAQRFYARYGFSKAGEYDYPVGRTLDREFILRG